jgi:hypothetical protein
MCCFEMLVFLFWCLEASTFIKSQDLDSHGPTTAGPGSKWKPTMRIHDSTVLKEFFQFIHPTLLILPYSSFITYSSSTI